MGMYTAFHFAAELKRNVPDEVVDALTAMVGDNVRSYHTPPDHPLFGGTRWRHMLQMDSYYFAAESWATFRYDNIAEAWFLTVTSNFKNYDNEIKKFLDWIAPYVVAHNDQFMGYWRYECDDRPSLFFMGPDGKFFLG